MQKKLLILLLLVQTFGCSGSDFTIPAPETPPAERPGNPDEPGEPVHYVASAAELKALGELAPGTEVVWRNGVYADQTVELRSRGTAAEPVRLRAETPGGVVFTGTSRLNVSGSGAAVSGLWWRDPVPVRGKAVVTFAKGSSECTLSDCAVTGDHTAEDAATDTKWVSLYGSGHTVRGCTFRDKRNIGALLVVWPEAGTTPRHTIARNLFLRPVTLYDERNKAINGQETIRIGTSDVSMSEAACTVEENCFYHCHGEQAEIISNKSCGNLYRRNLFVESQGTLTMRHGNGCTASGNYFIGNGMEGTGGIRLIGEGHIVEGNYLEGLAGSGFRTAICLVRGEEQPELNGYWQVKEARVRGNVIVDCACAFNVNYGSNAAMTRPVVSTRIEGNTVSISPEHADYYAVRCATDPEPDIVWADNAICGGRQSGVSLPVTDAVTLPDAAPAVEEIRRAAGCSWKTE